VTAIGRFSYPNTLIGQTVYLKFASMNIAATAATTFNIQKNGTNALAGKPTANVGAMVFAPSAAAATFTMKSATVFNPGDVLTVIAPATPDATLANLAWTIMGITQ
jgi:hypothetical protein